MNSYGKTYEGRSLEYLIISSKFLPADPDKSINPNWEGWKESNDPVDENASSIDSGWFPKEVNPFENNVSNSYTLLKRGSPM